MPRDCSTSKGRFNMSLFAISICRMRPLRPAAACKFSFISLKTTQAFGKPEVTIAVGIRLSSSKSLRSKLSRPASSRKSCVQMSRGVSIVSGPSFKKSVHLPMFSFAFSIRRSTGTTSSGKLLKRLYAARSAEVAMQMPLILKSFLGKSAIFFYCTFANFERTSRSRSPPCTCR